MATPGDESITTIREENGQLADEPSAQDLSAQRHQVQPRQHDGVAIANPPATSEARPLLQQRSSSLTATTINAYNQTTESDSGTEADDEHFRLGLRTTRSRSRNGVTAGDVTSGTLSPVLSASSLRGEVGAEGYLPGASRGSKYADEQQQEARRAAEKFKMKRRTELLRRILEILLLVGLGITVFGCDRGRVMMIWYRELGAQALIFGVLCALYPLRLLFYLASSISFEKWPAIAIPDAFDPAALLYPPLISIYIATLLSYANPGIILPNVTLGISSLLTGLLPSFANGEDSSILHWFLSCIPVFIWQTHGETRDGYLSRLPENNINPEFMVLLFPLHRVLCSVLYSLTTTSLLETELQLFSIAMINVLIMARSPQIIILRALLWIGGVGLFISCGFVLRWLAMLERIPKWRFKRAENLQKGMKGKPKSVLMAPFVRVRGLLSRAWKAIEDSEDEPGVLIKQDNFSPKAGNEVDVSSDKDNGTAVPAIAEEVGPQPGIEKNPKPLTRLGSIGRKFKPSKTTPSGRRKRSASASMQGFLGLTETQATLRRLAYAAYAYACIVLIILVVIREYVQRYALRDIEPVGWALSYLFGNLQWFRMQVLLYGLDSWIPLPDHTTPVPVTPFHGAWIEELRQNFGLANTRLFVSAYFATVITFGISIVVFVHMVDVDTRRKVFHFTMVAMLLPCTYIDPVYVAFALSLMLAIFLLLDLFRAAQLPPLAKPLRAFLAPYVDGRDLRGPVVVSHVFLLIGCAIPLWLSMAATGRDETGWDVPVRDVSMLSGVICVGLGDAAASLVGRRFGRHKWIWPGGKSIEGTVAFALAVGVATLAAKCWLRLGGWTDGGGAGDAFVLTLLKAGFAAGTASMTEAVLTGGNDNVIVPIVFWVCVKGLKI